MSANPTRVDANMLSRSADAVFPLQEGNRVLESLARQEALRALLAFSDLHERIRNRADSDLFQTETFVLDEVLQLICERAVAITHADGVLVALQDGSEMICRASAGPLAVERDIALPRESEFLQDCLDSSSILRCDDCHVDGRVELDLSREMGARSSVLVPLRGHRARLGVLQAFSNIPFAFSDDDVRCFDLFAELILSALKPEDQDRRVTWLAGVVDEVIGATARRSGVEHVLPSPDQTEVTRELAPPDEIGATGTLARPDEIEAPLSPAPSAPLAFEAPAIDQFPTAIASPPSIEPSLPEPLATDEVPTEPLVPPPCVPAYPVVEEVGYSLDPTPTPPAPPEKKQPQQIREEFEVSSGLFDIARPEEPAAEKEDFVAPAFLPAAAASRSPHPGLSVVLILVAVAALFSAGVWFGMRQHASDGSAKAQQSPAIQPQPVSTAASDHLMDPAQSNTSVYTGADRLSILPKVTGIRHWATPVGSTVVIDMQDQAPYEVHRLMSPERIYFDLHDTALVPNLEGRSIDVGDVALSRVRVAQPIPGVTRIVLDTRDGSNFSVSMESNPYRLVVELRANDNVMASNRAPNSDTRAAKALTPIPTRPEDEQLRAKAGIFRIALDAGHGGWDLGTVGRNGLQEKDLVLDVTRRLGKLLQARLGSEVIFTRTGDTYLPLDERADFANQAQADLFVSVHANYSSAASARGVETYFTNTFTAPGSRDTDKRENESITQFAPVALSAGELHDKIEESRRLAASIQRSLYGVLSATNPGIRDRGVKDSQFVVLTGTAMPAILTEISFVSSPADERNLQSDTYRQQIAEALYKGISRYAAGAHRVKVAEAQQSLGMTSGK